MSETAGGERQPNWVSLRAVLALHDRQIAIHGGLQGIRDEGLLESALMRPQNLWAYSAETPPIERLAAAYAFGICNNHPFNDGNKRSAFLAMYVFIRRNDLTFNASEADVVTTFLALASGDLSEDDLTDWIIANSGSANSSPRNPPLDSHPC